MSEYYISEPPFKDKSDQNKVSRPNIPKKSPESKDNSQYKYNKTKFNLELRDVLVKIVKYLVEGLAVAFVAYYLVGRNKLNIRDIVILGITAAFVFAILDIFTPTIALGARFGAGFGIGQGLFGFAPAMIAGPSVIAPLI